MRSLSPASWARPWRAADPAGRTGPRIAVIGNCQAAGLAASVGVLAPSARVTLVPVAALRRRHASVEALARALAPFDHVYAQPVPAGFLPPGDPAAFTARVAAYPTVVFPAFHPDMVYVGGGDGPAGGLAAGRLLPSPLGNFYHSAIVLFAFLEGLDEARTVALFREEVFAQLGYLGGWEAAAADFLRNAEVAGLGLEREFLRWSRRGNFMHVLNHPKLPVLGDIARRLLEASGLAPAEVEVGDYLADELARDVVWPVYPPLAEHFGVPGSYLFKGRARPGEVPVLHDLAGFVAASFAFYRTRPRAALCCQRIEIWRGRPEVAELFA